MLVVWTEDAPPGDSTVLLGHTERQTGPDRENRLSFDAPTVVYKVNFDRSLVGSAAMVKHSPSKVDPETGEATRFCKTCQAFLPLGEFYPSSIRTKNYVCKTHTNERTKHSILRWRVKRRGAPGSIARIRTNLNLWLYRQKRSDRWSDDDVEKALHHHGVALQEETRIVRIRPRDPTMPLTTENSVIKFQNGSSAKKIPTTTE